MSWFGVSLGLSLLSLVMALVAIYYAHKDLAEADLEPIRDEPEIETRRPWPGLPEWNDEVHGEAP